MDLNTIIISVIVLLACALVVIAAKRNNTKKKNRILKELFSFAEESSCKITEFDYWHNTKIGIDRVKQRLFFIRKIKDNESKKVINLSEIQRARVDNITRVVGEGKNKQSVTDKVELGILYSDKSKPETSLQFYNTDYDSLSLSGELQLAEKWAVIVNSVIAGNKG